jgi:hypothetical protein
VALFTLKSPVFVLIAASALFGQSPARPDGAALDLFEKQPSEKPLACEARTVGPSLTYRMLYRAGYVISVPMGQFDGLKRDFGVLVRITPREPAGGQPLYLKDLGAFPSDSGESKRDASKFLAQITGGFLLGEGVYHVDLLLVDGQERICRKQWDVELNAANPMSGALAAGQLAALSQIGWPRPGARAGSLTVLLHAGPERMNSVLLDALGGIVDHMHFSRLQVVAFSLDQHKELIRQNIVDAGGFRRVAEALKDFNPSTVSYSVLKNPAGHRELLWGLLAKEGMRAEPPEAVLFLGPPTIDDAHVPVPPACADGARKTVYVYFEFEALRAPRGRSPDRRRFQLEDPLPADPVYRRRAISIQPQLPDAISRVTRACSGKVYHIYSPGDLASALEKTDELVRAH